MTKALIRKSPWGGLPYVMHYEATTSCGRRVNVHAVYDDGRPDDCGACLAYAQVKRVLDAQTREVKLPFKKTTNKKWEITFHWN